MDSLPLIGRFHDQRYLLGLHLLAPLVIATGAPEILAPLKARNEQLSRGIAFVVTGFALVVAISAAGGQMRTVQGARAELQAWAPGFAPVLNQARAPSDGATVAMTWPARLEASTTPLSWLRRHGVVTLGWSLHHYTHGYEVANWLFRPGSAPLRPEEAGALLIQALLDESGDLQTTFTTDVDLVRSDVLVSTSGPSLDGFGIAWWESGAWRVKQHPTVDLGVGHRPDPSWYRRVGSIDAPDPQILNGLPVPGPGGRIVEGSPPVQGAGTRRVVVQIDEPGWWLRVGQSWHPRWEVTVDGEPSPHFMLLPGNLGVPVQPGEHEIELTWRVSPWRGAWAGLNVLLVLGLLGVGLLTKRS